MVRESISRQVDEKSGVPEEEREIWGSQGGGKDKRLFYFLSLSLSTFLSLSHIKDFFFFKPGMDDYTTNNSGFTLY